MEVNSRLRQLGPAHQMGPNWNFTSLGTKIVSSASWDQIGILQVMDLNHVSQLGPAHQMGPNWNMTR